MGKLKEALVREITIITYDNHEKMKIANRIHNQLVGNKDYIDSNIVLNADEHGIVKLYIFKECEDIPTISI